MEARSLLGSARSLLFGGGRERLPACGKTAVLLLAGVLLIATHYLAAPLKGAGHKNAATLLVAFLVSPEGQAIWGKEQGQTSMFVKGSPAYNYVQKKNAVSLEKKFALGRFEDLTNKYGKLLGFR